MWPTSRDRLPGTAAIIGGVMGVILAPIMVMVKYLTGWAVIPEPSWIAVVKPALGGLLTFSTPANSAKFLDAFTSIENGRPSRLNRLNACSDALWRAPSTSRFVARDL